MSFIPFAMERWQSTYEHHVAANLSESGVEPLTVSGLLEAAGGELGDLAELPLEYIQSNGSARLRDRVAALHPGANRDSVLITSGSAEANFLSTWELADGGGEIVFMEPNYFQVHGVARSLGATVREWWLERGTWAPDLAALDELVTDRTRMIVVTTPNNPTGARFDESFRPAVVAAAERVGAWILSDEVYRGAELDGRESRGFWGSYDRVIVTGGLSKAYALPGLRVGWAVTTADMAARLWARKDYTTISVGAVNQALAEMALHGDTREWLLERTRGILRSNWPILEGWLEQRRDTFRWRAPGAGAIAMVDYELPVDSLELVEKLRAEADVLLVPGDHFQLPRSLRIGFGNDETTLRDGLARMAGMLDPLRATGALAGA